MSRPVGEVLFDWVEAQKDHASAREMVLRAAMEEGATEQFLNGDHRIAVAYLRGVQGRKK